MFAWLARHPQIFAPWRKEPTYFSQNFGRGENWYRRFYAGLKPGQIGIDASTEYFVNPLAPERMIAFDPEAAGDPHRPRSRGLGDLALRTHPPCLRHRTVRRVRRGLPLQPRRRRFARQDGIGIRDRADRSVSPGVPAKHPADRFPPDRRRPPSRLDGDRAIHRRSRAFFADSGVQALRLNSRTERVHGPGGMADDPGAGVGYSRQHRSIRGDGRVAAAL